MRADLLLPILLLSTDLALIGIHLVYSYTDRLADQMYSLQRERGYGEQFQYVKLYWLVVLFGLLAVVRRQLIHLVWMVVFAAMLIDDCFGLHEAYGFRLARTFELEPVLGLRPRDLGELLVMAAAGTTLLVLLTAAYIGANAAARGASLRIVGLGAGLAFFGGVLDAVHAIARGTWAAVPIGAAEDGGELVMISFILWAVFHHAQPLAAWAAASEPYSLRKPAA